MPKNALNSRAVRISLACAPCRSRHLKCNGATPVCSRCEEEGSTCVWMKSRRGGKPRNNKSPSGAQASAQADVNADGNTNGVEASPPSWGSLSLTGINTARAISYGENPGLSGAAQHSPNDGHIQKSLIDLYYTYFHDAHPCVLPRPYLERAIQRQLPGTESLLAVVLFIGSLYTAKVPTEPLEARVKESLTRNSDNVNGFEVQAMVLYATAVYWRDGYEAGVQILNTAIDKGVFQLQMHKRHFAVDNGLGWPVIEESWRRTWWMIYMTEIHMAAIGHWPSFRTSGKHVESTAELPCEELEYESGRIPEPRTEQDFENREFDDDYSNGYSSFAYLVGLLRKMDHFIAAERNPGDIYNRTRCANGDAALLGWWTLIPKEKRNLVGPDGKTDELLWKAECLVSAYVVEMHRPFSSLSYNPVEMVSSCAPPPPPERIDPAEYWDAPVHTRKISRAIERQTELLTLHQNRIAHSPFSICMIAAVAVTHLSACKFVFRGEDLIIARERIRASIGILEAFAEVWSQAKRISWEVKTIAREVLGLGKSTPAPRAISAERQAEASATVATPCTPGSIDWSDFAMQMDHFNAAGFAGFEEHLEASFGGSEATFSAGNSSDIAVS